MAMAVAIGSTEMPIHIRYQTTVSRTHPGEPTALDSGTTGSKMKQVAVRAVAYASHLSCWRSCPLVRHNRRNGEAIEMTQLSNINTHPKPPIISTMLPKAPPTASGLTTEG